MWRAVVESNASRGRSAWLETRRLAGWWAAAVFAGAMNLYALATAGPQWTAPADAATYGWWDRGIDAVRAYLHYASSIVWPSHVAVYYGQTRVLLEDPGTRVVVAVVIAALILLLARRATRMATAGWLGAVLIALAPFVGQMNRTFHASDRYAVLALAVCAVAIARWLARRSAEGRAFPRFAVCAVAIVAASILYARALPNWRDTDALQASIDRSTARHPDVYLGYARAARAYWSLGEKARAERRLAAGDRLFPDDPQLRETEEELRVLDARLRQRLGDRTDIPPAAVMQVDLGRTWMQRGERTAALAHFAQALALAPDYDEAKQGYLSAKQRP